MIARHGLANTPYSDVSSWRSADFVFSWNYDMFGDGSEARRLGFREYVEMEAMFVRIFDDSRQCRIIPG